LNPHYGPNANGEGSGDYQNELQRDPTAAVKETNPNLPEYWEHPAQARWNVLGTGSLIEKPFTPPNRIAAAPEQRQRWLDAWDEYLENPNSGWRRHEEAEHVPVEALKPYMEYDRDLDANQYTRDLYEHVKQHGIQEPVFLDYNPETGLAHVSEGNHRLKMAEALGISHVPTIGYRSRRVPEKMQPLPVPGNPVEPQRYDPTYVPPYIRPSALGLPTAPAPRTSSAAFATELKLWLDDVGRYLNDGPDHHHPVEAAKHKKKRQTDPKPWIPLEDQYEAMKNEWYESEDGEGHPLEWPYDPEPWRKEHHAPIPQLASVQQDGWIW
jgi:hypothetical protein